MEDPITPPADPGDDPVVDPADAAPATDPDGAPGTDPPAEPADGEPATDPENEPLSLREARRIRSENASLRDRIAAAEQARADLAAQLEGAQAEARTAISTAQQEVTEAQLLAVATGRLASPDLAASLVDVKALAQVAPEERRAALVEAIDTLLESHPELAAGQPASSAPVVVDQGPRQSPTKPVADPIRAGLGALGYGRPQ